MEILSQGLDYNLEAVYNDFQDTFGIGPCGAYCALRREQGWGEIAVCLVTLDDSIEFPHYIIVQDNAIIDMSLPLDESVKYSEIEMLEANEMPELIDEHEVKWLRDRIAD